MIIVDANLLLYAYNSTASKHQQAKEWFESVVSGSDIVGLPWVSILAFIRISTNHRAVKSPLSTREAKTIVDTWLERPNITSPNPGESHWEILAEVLITGQVTGPLVSDAYLAALSIEHGATLYSTDRDFSRFDKLSFVNPLD